MRKRNKIIYWIATIWLSLGMLSSGIVQVIQLEEEVDMIVHLGYPTYLLTILGISKISGVVCILIPKYPLLKEWAYAGFSFTLCGAILSHMATGDSVIDILPPLFLLILTAVSWYFRPADKKISVTHP